MPELPEVETVMRGLARVLTGERIVAARTTRAGLRFPFPPDLAERLTGARVESLRRRAKYMLLRLDHGSTALIHLGMSGRMVARPLAPDAAPEAHEHLVLETGSGMRVGLVDPRRFGVVDLMPSDAEDTHRLLAGLGPEPLEDAFTPAVLGAALAGRGSALKAALLDQRLVAGLGNIYVSEALHRARLSPHRAAGSLTGPELRRLVPAIKAVLEDSIAAGGSSLRDYVHADGGLGFFQDRFQVYDRAGQPCARCPGPPRCAGIERTVQGGRATFHCPRYQR